MDAAPRKPKNPRARRFLKSREPKINENTKAALFVKGHRTSQLVNTVLKDLWMLKKPDGRQLNKKNNVVKPFEDETMLEFLTTKNDSSLFAIGSHTKRRPQNVVMGRMYNAHVLDMFEFGVTGFKELRDFKNDKSAVGSKPCMVFQGDLFDSDEKMSRARSLLLDFFRGTVVENIALAGLDHVIVCTATDATTILFRHYRIELKKSGTRLPLVQLVEIGPSIDLTLRRSHVAAPDLYAEANRVPRVSRPTKTKNVATNALGEQRGRVHMGRQDLDKLALKRSKGLRAGAAPPPAAAAAGAEDASAGAAGASLKRRRDADDDGGDDGEGAGAGAGAGDVARRPGKRKKKSVKRARAAQRTQFAQTE